MEITETERLMLVKKKEEICGATFEILKIASNPLKEIEIKKDMTLILSLLSTIASYANPKSHDLDAIEDMVNTITSQFDLENYSLAELMLGVFCNTVNSIVFDFNHKEGIKITLPKNLNFGNIIHQ
jgi:hypothetical protein